MSNATATAAAITLVPGMSTDAVLAHLQAGEVTADAVSAWMAAEKARSTKSPASVGEFKFAVSGTGKGGFCLSGKGTGHGRQRVCSIKAEAAMSMLEKAKAVIAEIVKEVGDAEPGSYVNEFEKTKWDKVNRKEIKTGEKGTTEKGKLGNVLVEDAETFLPRLAALVEQFGVEV